MNCAAILFLGFLASDVQVGSRVRIATEAETLTGTVEAIRADALDVRLDCDCESRSVPFSDVTELERSLGRRSRGQGAWSKAKWGILIGAVPGAISLALQHDEVGEEGSSVGEAAALGAWSGGLFGGLIGAVMGAMHPGETWERVTPSFQLGSLDGTRGFSLSVSISF